MNIDIVSEIINVIDIEIKGLSHLKERINASVKKAVEAIFNCQGKVIVTGMGKSGLVAKKIASTMSSVGTPAIFMHPAEGMHGDLGIIGADDVVIAIGKRLIMTVADVMLKGNNNPLINISDRVKNCILRISEKQAGAVSVVDDNGKLIGLITDYDIRKHLEKEENIFSMKIEDIMNPKPMSIYEDEKAFSALKIMQEREKPITVIPVLNRENIVVGMLRLQDLVKEGL